jgi:hypothetical protein
MIQFKPGVIVQLSKLADRVGILSKIPKVVALDIAADEAVKLEWMANKSNNGKPKRPQRDFETMNDNMKERVQEAWGIEARKILKGTSTDRNAPWVRAAVEAGKVVRARIADGHGGDVKMAPLAESTIEKKKAAGLRVPTHIGYATGDLYRAITNAVNGRKVIVKW